MGFGSSILEQQVNGEIIPLKKRILVTDMYFGDYKTKGGIILQSDDGAAHGVKPRWAKVYKVGKDQNDVKVGEWVLVEHGRWTRGFKQMIDGEEKTVRMVDEDAILGISNEKMDDIYFGDGVDGKPGVTHKPEDFGAGR